MPEESNSIYNFQNPTDQLGLTGEQDYLTPGPEPEVPKPADPVSPFMRNLVTEAVMGNPTDNQAVGLEGMGMKDPLEQLADQENDLPSTEIPVSGTEVAEPVKEETTEVKELKNKVAELEEQIRQLKKLLEAKAEVKTGEEPEPKEILPVEVPKGWGGESWIEGVGHDVAMEATESFAEEAQKPERKGLWEKAKEKGSRWSKWIERAKGLGTFGYWEVHQAEKVRVAGRDVQQGIETGAKDIQQESGLLSYEDAWDEAQKMKDLSFQMVTNNEVPTGKSTKEILDAMSEAISGEKREENQKLEDQMVSKALETIKAKVAGYKTYGGEKVDLSEAKLREIEDKLRSGIGALRISQLEADKIKFNEVVRQSVDPDWYKRYVAGGIEAVLGFAGVYWVTMPGGPLSSWVFGKGTIGAGKETVKQILHPVTGSGGENFISGPIDPATKAAYETLLPTETDPTKPLTSNLWNMAKQLFAEKGVPNPTDSQIMEVTKQLATDNSTAVEKWGMAGKILDTKMPFGMAIKVGRAALLVGKLAGHATGVL